MLFKMSSILRPILNLTFFLLAFASFAQPTFYPPHWFKGLKNSNLEIIVQAERELKAAPELLQAEGLKLISSTLAPNPKYAYLSLDLSNFSGDQFKIKVGGKSYTYTLKSPQTSPLSTLNPSDAIYLITPDRFVNGDPKNDKLKGMNEPKYGREHPFGRHGGDIAGIRSKLDYIKDLGFTAHWISPLLENNENKESYHGYAITNHYLIDPRFGSNQDYAALVEESHQKGLKVVMDVVYNHFGSQHAFHLDPPDSSFFHFDMKNTRSNFRAVALMDPHVSEADRKKFSEGWFDDHMPDVNQQNPQVANFLIQNSLWWILEYGLDAFRIDTYAYSDQKFLAELGRRIKLERPNFFLFGEIWVHFPEIQSYFAGQNAHNPHESHLDAVTDFQFKYGVKEALKQGQSWTGGVGKLYYRLAADYLYKDPSKLVTFIDNHDEARIYGELQDLNKLKVALTWLYTMRGIPCTYYGTEILMKETKDHGVIRQPFPGGWPGDAVDKFDYQNLSADEKEAQDLMRQLLALRKTSGALKQGGMKHFIPENEVYAYFRYTENETIMVVANVHPTEARELDLNRFREMWPVFSEGYDLIENKTLYGSENLPLAPMSARVIRIKR